MRSFGKEDEEIRKYSEAVATTRAYGLSMSWLYGTFQAGAEFASYIRCCWAARGAVCCPWKGERRLTGNDVWGS